MTWFVGCCCDLRLLFGGIRGCELIVIDLWKGRKALRDPPPTKILADGSRERLDWLFIVSLDDLDEVVLIFGRLIFVDKFLSFSLLVKVIWSDGGVFFGLGGTIAIGGGWFEIDLCCIEGGKWDCDAGKLWLRIELFCWGCLNCCWYCERCRGAAGVWTFDVDISITGWTVSINGRTVAVGNRSDDTRIKYLTIIEILIYKKQND